MNSTIRRYRLNPFLRFTTWLVIVSLFAGTVPSFAQSPGEAPSGPGRIGVAAHESGWVCSVILDEMPSVRGQSRVGHFAYGNRGSEPIDIPYVHLDAGEGTSLRFLPTDEWTGQLELMAISGTAPASKLDPGEFRQIAFFYKSEGDAVSVHCGYTLSDPSAFGWDALGNKIRPHGVPDELWNLALDVFRKNIGDTWNGFFALMRSDCDYLAEIGQVEYRLPEIWKLETADALGEDHAIPSLAAEKDLVRDTREGELALARSYGTSLRERFTRGPFGWGWTDSLSWMDADPLSPFAVERDGEGRIISARHKDGQGLYLSYDENGCVVSAADDQGRIVRYEYDNGLLVRVVSRDGRETRYRYFPADGSATSRALRQVVEAGGPTRDFSYDARGRVASVSMNRGQQTIEIVRRPHGSYALVMPGGAVAEVTVNTAGEVVKVSDGQGHETSCLYLPDGLLSAVTGPTGKRSSIEYDRFGRPAVVKNALNAGISFSYDSDLGVLDEIRDPLGNAFAFAYDDLLRPVALSWADGSSERVTYSDEGDVVRACNRRGQAVDYEYDDEGRLVRETWPDGRTFSWTFDGAGNCVRAEDSKTGTVEMTYDDADRLTRIEYPGGRGFAETYDARGRLASRTLLGDGGAVQRYSYDEQDRLVRMTAGDGSLLVEKRYDNVTGLLAEERFGNGTATTYAYDSQERVARIAHLAADGSELAFCGYEYDAEGHCTAQTTAEGVERYKYDDAGQLVGVVYPDRTGETFAYDLAGNRTATRNGFAGTVRYAVNDLNQYLSVEDKNGKTLFDYDADGNLVRKTGADGAVTEYAYDVQNRLVSVTSRDKDIDWTCEYDVFGNRVRVTDHGRTVEKLYLQGELASVAAEYVGGRLAVRHILEGDTHLADCDASGNAQWYHADNLASTRLVTDERGNKVATASYRVFGAPRSGTGGTGTAGWIGTLGVERDPTGLVFMRGRYYDPELGRFIQMYPIGLEGGDVNLYRYCQNDAIGAFDLDGCQAVMTASSATTSVTAAELAEFEARIIKLGAARYAALNKVKTAGQILKQTIRIAYKSGLAKKIGRKVLVKVAAVAARIVAKHVAANALNAVPWVLAALVIWDVVDIIWTIMRPLMKPLLKVLKATIRALRPERIWRFDPDKYNPYKPNPKEKVTPTEKCNPVNPKPDPCEGLLERKKELEKEIGKCKEEAQKNKNNPFWKMLYQEDCDKKANELKRVLEEMKDAGCGENIDYPS